MLSVDIALHACDEIFEALGEKTLFNCRTKTSSVSETHLVCYLFLHEHSPEHDRFRSSTAALKDLEVL